MIELATIQNEGLIAIRINYQALSLLREDVKLIIKHLVQFIREYIKFETDCEKISQY